MDRTERGAVALLVGYLGTLAVTALIDEPAVWLTWATAAVIVTGATLIAYNQ